MKLWARIYCLVFLTHGVSPPRFLAYSKRRVNQGGFLLLYFRLFTVSDMYWVCVCVFSYTFLFVSISQVIGCEDCLWSDQLCRVGLYSISKLKLQGSVFSELQLIWNIACRCSFTMWPRAVREFVEVVISSILYYVRSTADYNSEVIFTMNQHKANLWCNQKYHFFNHTILQTASKTSPSKLGAWPWNSLSWLLLQWFFYQYHRSLSWCKTTLICSVVSLQWALEGGA